MRISLRLAAVSLALTLLWLVVAGASADPATPPAQETVDTATQSKPAEPNEKNTPARGAGEQAPSDSFTPSETISADSAVSFPVDI